MRFPGRSTSLPFYVGVGLAIAALAWIIRKEVQLPSALIVGVGGAALVGLLVSALRKPEVCLYAMAAYLPFNRVLVGDFGTQATGLNLTNILMGFVSLGWFLRASRSRERLFQRTALNGWILLFAVLGMVSVVRGSLLWTGQSFNMNIFIQLKRWLTPMWLFFIGANIVKARDTIKRLMIIMSLTVIVIAAMAVRDYTYVSGASLEHARIEGVLGHPNALGAFFAYYMFLMAGVFLERSKRFAAWLLLAPLALVFRGIMVTFSRGAYLACAAGAFACAFYRSKRLCALGLAVAVAAIVNPVLLPAGIRYRFSQMVVAGPYDAQLSEDSLEASSRTRIEIWKGSLRMIKDFPLLGAGYDMFQHLLPYYTPERISLDAHNTYLLVAAEMGIPALAVFLIILLTIYGHAVTLYRRSKDPLIRALALGFTGGAAALFISNLFGSRMNAEDLISYYWLLAGAVVAAKGLLKRGVLQ